ncbi:hypothetical protein [Pseudobacteriovorax antillogorgiicola]|uniref:Iron-containing redox enzyme n=1 Tax=Pseudobacteriovorax antillogorgiicola TaxID=1513793 RepID=A0A1Y6CL19_9BACT|nr:hypothetical protein [Pseudobacteriovorax antillogorgiicola]TCS45686.1 hypothetical protein EDD56_12780 [Pseudobacteriovorax antillogorgiicola]SMF73222.1 hypothetical protein SAMN06296036_12779 [Pseudobacteriovorax antillogorgiicola]
MVLHQHVESVYHDMKLNNRFYAKIFKEAVDVDYLSIWTTGILALVQHTPLHLNLARKISQERNLNELERYFANKIPEEQGHDEWAIRDLDLQRSYKPQLSIEELPVLPEMHCMIRFIENTIRADPKMYLAYIFFAEYMTVLSTPDLIEGLESNSGISGKAISILGNHADLDKEHVSHWTSEVSDIIDFEKDKDSLIGVIDQAAKLYITFCNAIFDYREKVFIKEARG